MDESPSSAQDRAYFQGCFIVILAAGLAGTYFWFFEPAYVDLAKQFVMGFVVLFMNVLLLFAPAVDAILQCIGL